MLKETIVAARSIKGELIPTEDSIDMALGRLGQLISTACKARIEGGLPVHLGQEAMGHLTAATAMMAELRGRVIAAHQCFAEDGRRILPVTALGDTTRCPAQGNAETSVPHEPLRVVA
jgi:hypothetical protein